MKSIVKLSILCIEGQIHLITAFWCTNMNVFMLSSFGFKNLLCTDVVNHFFDILKSIFFVKMLMQLLGTNQIFIIGLFYFYFLLIG